MHYAAELQRKQAHDEFEDTDIMKLLLEYNGDTNIHTKMVNFDLRIHIIDIDAI